MNEKERLSRRAKFEERRSLQKKVATDFFLCFSSLHRPWLKELAAWYKAKGEFPLFPTFIADYYTDPKDKEIALFSSLLMSDNDRVYEQVQDMRSLITEHPYKWFTERGFVSLSLGANQQKALVGYRLCRYWKIAYLMNWLYGLANGSKEQGTFEKHFTHDTKDSLEELKKLELHIGDFRLRFLSLVLRTSDGFGAGLWNSCQSLVRCPLTESVKEFLTMWFPDYHTRGLTEDEAIGQFGFERDCDFFYAMLAWKELCRKKPKECKLYARKYRTWYDLGCRKKKSRWNGIIPEIPASKS
jgi:hypothetical protein